MVDSDKLPFVGENISEPEYQLLSLISECSGKVEGRTKLMKLVFFSEYYDPDREDLQPNEQNDVFSDFFIYRHGPFSKNVMETFTSLKDKNMIKEDTELTFMGNRKKIIKLTDKGKDKQKETRLGERTQNIVTSFKHESATDLEKKSLLLLGIDREEKEDHLHKHVTDLID